MKLKVLILLFLCLIFPKASYAYYVYRPCCCNCNRLAGWWVDADYLLAWRRDRFYPPLLTTNSIVPPTPPVLGDPNTIILFGNQKLGCSPRSGFRFDGGLRITECFGIGAGFFNLATERINFSASGDLTGHPVLGRPFFNRATGMEDVELISFPSIPPIIDGFFDFSAVNRIWGADVYMRLPGYRNCDFKLDVLAGIYFNQIDDNLTITDHHTVPLLPPVIPPGFNLFLVTKVKDQFKSSNNYYAGMLGFTADWRCQNWAIRSTLKVGLGNMRQVTKIKGTTTILNQFTGLEEVLDEGLLAQLNDNIGRHCHNRFEVVPDFSIKLQYRAWARLWLSVGYNVIYWPGVVLAGEQVNLRINPATFPNKNTNFWMQAATAGVYIFY
jgi:Putative beta barrel porin-7 (BBP7)